ncbi:MAG: hypothetical protein ACE366_03200 [Bradymonadia bacterium]
MMKWSSLMLALVGAWGCGDLTIVEGNPCSQGPDCIYPSVCCTNPRIPPIGASVPYCEDIDYCDGFMPVLIEGNPCNRSGGSSIDSCADPWVCCPNTLTCLTQEACTETMPLMPPDAGPPPEVADDGVPQPMSLPCTADPDCPQGLVCMGINMVVRGNGMCQPIPQQSF